MAEKIISKRLRKKEHSACKRDVGLLILPTVYVVMFLIVPLISIFILGIRDESGFTLEYYKDIFHSNVYQKVLFLTIRTSLLVTVITLLLAYPVAYAMTICSRRVRAIIKMFVMIPFWSSVLVRTFAWIVLLQSKGVVNSLLQAWGITEEPVALLYNNISVTVGMVNALLPYMILSLYAVLDGIDRNLMSASDSLGAGRATTFFKVYLPLSLNGVANGCVMVFVMSMGYYITPSLLGGGDTPMISQYIDDQVSKLLNWNTGSAAAFVLLITTMLILTVSNKLLRKKY